MADPRLQATPAPAQPRDRLGSAITVAAIVIFVATGSAVLSTSLGRLAGGGSPIDRVLLIALLLNVALILFGWRRHAEMRDAAMRQANANMRAAQLASTDPLTGFLNRRALIEEGGAMIAQANRRHKVVALMLLDLDHFKRVNDMYGHGIGDGLLRHIADELAAAMPSVALAARLDGDEFGCAFLFDPSVPQTVDRVAESLMSRMARPFIVDGLELHVTASIGIARTDVDSPSIDALMRSADIAMHAAKQGGRRQYVWFDASMERELRDRNQVEVGLRTAIPQHQIIPYFDQQVELATGKLVGFEVLARWDHPTRGLLMPDAFLAIATEAGLVNELSFSVMRQAFAQALDWDPSLSLSVNLAPAQMKDAWLAQKLIKLLAETGFPAARLEIEITEAAMFDDLPLAQSIVASLKNQGIRVSLDDFGTGYSSLAHLRALPFDQLKIDRSFIASINDNAESAAIVTAITRLGDSLSLAITAEGIEDSATEARVRALGCARGQGYLYGRPMTAAKTRSLLAERRLLRPAAQSTVPVPGETVRRAG